MIVNNDIAVIGIGGLFPEAGDVATLYRHLLEGRDSIRLLSPGRIQDTSLDPELTYRPIGFLEDIDKFDHEFFNISRKEARNMAPQHRLLLEVVYRTVENAGYDPDGLRGTETAVFLSSTGLDYIQLAEEPDPTLKVNNLNATMAGRIARYFDWRGSAIMIDTACSSSLVAVHYACRELQSGDAEYALAGGVKLHVFPPPADVRDDLGILSGDGRTRSYSGDADGTGSGEAIGCVLLKPLNKALAEGDIIHAVIRGSAVNQDAALSSTLTAPDSRAQSVVILKAWDQAGIDASDIGYIEGHGTGTELGDPIEVAGLDLSFSARTDKRGFCALSSIKSNFGHTDSAAGICGLIKAVLSVKHRQLFPTVHFTSPNPLIDFQHSAVYVNAMSRPWVVEKGKKRIAGVSSFAISGTNCHLILEEAPETNDLAQPETGETAYLFPFSGRDQDSLRDNIRDIRTYIENQADLRLEDIAHTLGAGRKHYRHRYACIASHRGQLLDKLRQEAVELIATTMTSGAGKPTGTVPDKPILVFSRGSSPSTKEVAAYRSNSPVFNEGWSQCLLHWKKEENDRFRAFAFQYAFYRLLTGHGMSFKYMIGDELGKLIIAILKGEMELQTGLEKAMQLTPEEGGLGERMRKLLDKEGVENGIIFISLLPDAPLTRILEDMRQTAGLGITGLIMPSMDGNPLNYISRLYQWGLPIDFTRLQQSGSGKKIELPGYHFKKTRCWLRPPSVIVEQPDMPAAAWLHLLQWTNEPHVAGPATGPEMETGKETAKPARERLLVIGRKDPFFDSLLAALSVWDSCTAIARDEAQPLQKDARLKEVLHNMRNAHNGKGAVHRLIYIARPDEENIAGVYELHWLYGQLRGITDGWVVVSPCGPGFPQAASPYSELEQALLRGLQVEDPRLRVKHISLGAGEPILQAAQVTEELLGGDRISYVAYREKTRYIQRITGYPITPDKTPAPFGEGDTYLVTGGATGITHALCASIIRETGHCCFIICGRTPVDWDNENQTTDSANDKDGGRAAALSELRGLGARVEYYQTDITDKEAILRLKPVLHSRHERIEGVLHGAGMRCRLSPFEEKTPEEMAEVWGAKITGCHNLELLLEGYQPRWVALFSSIGAIVPHKNTTDYAIANAFLNGYARYMAQKGRPFVSICWPGWQTPEKGTGWPRETDISRIGIREGAEVLRHALAGKEPNVIVARVDREGFKINPFFKWEEAIDTPAREEAVILPETPEPLPIDTISRLTALWHEVLEADNISENDDFFELGGHSLNGNQLLARIEKAFGVRLEFEDLFDYCTIRKLAEYLDQTRETQPDNAYREIIPLTPQTSYPLSHAQKRLWVIHQFENSRTAYNLPGAFFLEGTFEVELFIRACEAVIRRHEILRTTFETDAEGPVQIVHSEINLDRIIARDDLEKLPDDRQVAILEDMYDREVGHVFDLRKGPLIRMTLVRLSGQRYLFLFNIHHIICDGWSINILLREILHFYSCYCRGIAEGLPALTIQYKDYAGWQQQQLQGESFKRHREYWLGVFGKEIPLLALPSDHPRPAMQTYNGDRVNFQLDRELTETIRKVAQQHEGTVFMVLVTLIHIVLHKYAGQPAYVVGIVSGGREHLNLEEQIGLYLNMLALYTEVREDDSFVDLFARVRESILSAFDHQVYPFDLLVEELNVARDMSRHPLFDVMIVSQNSAVGGRAPDHMGDLTINGWGGARQTSKVDLTFSVNEEAPELYISIEYNTDIYQKERIVRMGDHLKGIAAAAVKELGKKIAELEYMGEVALAKLWKGLQGTMVPVGENGWLPELFTAQAARSPEREAIRMADRSLTYRELEEKSNRLAHYLRGKGVKTETLVPVCIERCLEMVIGILGIWKAGGAYAPIDPEYPPERIAYMLDDMKAALVLSSRYGSRQLGAVEGTEIIMLDDLGGEDTLPATPPAGATEKGQLAYVIYTSGSTGRPKGVMIAHAGVMNHIQAKISELEMGDNSVVAFTASYTFDISVWQLFAPLVCGGRVVMYGSHLLEAPGMLLQNMAADGITILELVPSYLSALLAEREAAAMKELRYMVVTGEAVSRSLVQEWFAHAHYGHITMMNGYGPTEASDNVCHYKMHKVPQGMTIPIGHPIQNMRIYIVDGGGRLCPVGVPGEICVSGIGVSRGYWGRPELTAERFVTDPFAETEGGLMYRTGDLGSWLEEGIVVYLGRIDGQVKVNGYRVEPEEIERVLRQSEAVKEAVVAARPDGQGGSRLLGYVVPKGDWQPDALYALLRATLPAYMIPAQLLELDRIPLTPNGKIDRKALPDPSSCLPDAIDRGIPRDEVEAKLLELWKKAMGLEQIGIHDNFFELGGHSLLAIRLVSVICNELNIDISVSVLFQHPNIALLAKAIHFFRGNTVDAMEDYDEIEL